MYNNICNLQPQSGNIAREKVICHLQQHFATLATVKRTLHIVQGKLSNYTELNILQVRTCTWHMDRRNIVIIQRPKKINENPTGAIMY